MADATRFLDEAGIDFEVLELEHEHTERAIDEAAALGIGPDEVAKTLVVATPEGNVRAVLPASERIDLHKVADLVGASASRCGSRPRTSSRATTRTSSSAPCRRSAAERTE